MEVSLLTCDSSDQQQKHDRQPTGKHGSSVRCDFVKKKQQKKNCSTPENQSVLKLRVNITVQHRRSYLQDIINAACYRWLKLGAAASDSIKSFGPSSDWSALLSLIITVLALARLCLHPWSCGLCNTEELLAYNRSIFSCLFTQRVNKDKEQPQYWH